MSLRTTFPTVPANELGDKLVDLLDDILVDTLALSLIVPSIVISGHLSTLRRTGYRGNCLWTRVQWFADFDLGAPESRRAVAALKPVMSNG